MTWTVIGTLADQHTLAYHRGMYPTAWSHRSTDYRPLQPQTIPVDREHDHDWVGQVVHLERHDGNLWAVAEVDTEPFVRVKVGDEMVPVPTSLYFSAEGNTDDGQVILTSVAITHRAARIAARPLRWLEGDLGQRSIWKLERGGIEHQLVHRAAETNYTRFGRTALTIHNQPTPGRHQLVEPTGPLLIRSAETVDVHPARREIELIVIPYETPALVKYAGRMATETITRTAFLGVNRQPGPVRVNRDHNLERTIGKAATLDPHQRDGLAATLQIARTPLGDETLQLAGEGCLDASAGFRPNDGGMQWDSSSSYRITDAWLGHIALTPDPAYTDARVLAVRGTAA